jgi:hypothetical protein
VGNIIRITFKPQHGVRLGALEAENHFGPKIETNSWFQEVCGLKRVSGMGFGGKRQPD